LRIRLLGGLEVTSPENRQVRFATRKTALLFAALVLGGRRGYRRELLSEAFWPGRGNEQARNSLRQALVDIRRSFAAGGDATVYIDGDHETIALITSPDEADISVFDLKLEAGRTADLALAADLYRGDVLAGRPFRANWTIGSDLIGAPISARRCSSWSS
jgi:DNA-binding SARP family transcriptional activator